jgi:glyoxylase-like metal-dependent hydrolase (beta-lactamase superfamily II)
MKLFLDGLGNAPLKTVIDTHWHVGHTDNNANLHAAGATVLAHDNTKTRMAEPHDSALMGLHFPASPADALPQQTFSSSKELHAYGETILPSGPFNTTTFPPGPESKVRFSASGYEWIGTVPICARMAPRESLPEG